MRGIRINCFLRHPVSKILIILLDVTHVKVMVDEAAGCYKKKSVRNKRCISQKHTLRGVLGNRQLEPLWRM
jgi:hypothetical protein